MTNVATGGANPASEKVSAGSPSRRAELWVGVVGIGLITALASFGGALWGIHNQDKTTTNLSHAEFFRQQQQAAYASMLTDDKALDGPLSTCRSYISSPQGLTEPQIAGSWATAIDQVEVDNGNIQIVGGSGTRDASAALLSDEYAVEAVCTNSLLVLYNGASIQNIDSDPKADLALVQQAQDAHDKDLKTFVGAARDDVRSN
jgi:hypothetical protein